MELFKGIGCNKTSQNSYTFVLHFVEACTLHYLSCFQESKGSNPEKSVILHYSNVRFIVENTTDDMLERESNTCETLSLLWTMLAHIWSVFVNEISWLKSSVCSTQTGRVGLCWGPGSSQAWMWAAQTMRTTGRLGSALSCCPPADRRTCRPWPSCCRNSWRPSIRRSSKDGRRCSTTAGALEETPLSSFRFIIQA